jgi:ribosomal protein S18 acetylase RimI-like enzyme
MDGWCIGTLEPDQWARYRELRLEALAVEPRAFASNLIVQQQYLESYWRKRLADALVGTNEWLYFAERAGRLVGMIGAMVKGRPNTAELLAFYVSPGARGEGIGRSLLEHLLGRLISTSTVDWAELRVSAEQTAAIRIYEQVGFRAYDQEAHLVRDVPVTKLLLRRGVTEY